jgi:uncharacterized membrane protein YphA (DoxX/SURF4 family)
MLPVLVHTSIALFHKAVSYVNFIPPLATRLLVGFAFIATGHGKINNLEGVTKYFESLHVPMPAANAWFVGHLEYYGGMLLVAGLLARPIAGLLASTMVVATLTGEKDMFFSWWTGFKFEDGARVLKDGMPVTADVTFTEITAFALLIYLSWVVFYGPGKASVDFVLAKVLKIQTAEDAAKGVQPAQAVVATSTTAKAELKPSQAAA